jgi:hypothetical protein
VDQNELRYIWGQLSVAPDNNMVRNVKSVSNNGDYLSWGIAEDVSEVLLRATVNWSKAKMPNWEGMRFSLEKIQLDKYEQYVVMELLDKELEIPFACFCSDVLESLVDVAPKDRAKTLDGVIYIWNQFFSHTDDKTLPKNRQRGLFAELCWLRKLLMSEMTAITAVESWKGAQREIHDFEHHGKVVEVKSTITKEPRKVVISNERQLDDSELESLHLFVLTLDVHETGESLPDIVSEIESHLGKGSAAAKFKRKLILAEYLEADAKKYVSRYTKRHEELFKVKEAFPRIISFPQGIGDLTHSLQISACRPFQCNLEEHLGVKN